jgi:hypothetical protein
LLTLSPAAFRDVLSVFPSVLSLILSNANANDELGFDQNALAGRKTQSTRALDHTVSVGDNITQQVSLPAEPANGPADKFVLQQTAQKQKEMAQKAKAKRGSISLGGATLHHAVAGNNLINIVSEVLTCSSAFLLCYFLTAWSSISRT